MTRTVGLSASPVDGPATKPRETEPDGSAARPARRARKADAQAMPQYTPDRPEDRLSIRLLQAFDVCFARIYHRVNVLSPQRLPKHGPAILICNHVSGLDPMLIQAVCPRLIVWMMAREYYEIRGLSWAFRTIEAIPVDRSGRDLAATRAALRALEAGRILGVFPEGRIETSRELLPFQTGVALMAQKVGMPVYPAYLDGTQRGKDMFHAFAYPNLASLAFGPPIETVEGGSTSKEVLQGQTARYTESVQRLRALTLRAYPRLEEKPAPP